MDSGLNNQASRKTRSIFIWKSEKGDSFGDNGSWIERGRHSKEKKNFLNTRVYRSNLKKPQKSGIYFSFLIF